MARERDARSIDVRNRAGEVVARALVSRCDHEDVLRTRWRLHRGTGYILGRVGGKTTSLHQHVMRNESVPRGHVIDHWDRDKRNCTRTNLAVVTMSANMHNVPARPGSSSAYRGVSLAASGRWRAKCAGVHVGTYHTQEAAAYAHDRAAISWFGNRARINGVARPARFDALGTPQRIPREGLYQRKSGLWVARGVVSGRRITLGVYRTEAEARAASQGAREAMTAAKEAEILSRPISRNSEGLAVVITSGGHEVILDEERYHQVVWRRWQLSTHGYAYTTETRPDGRQKHVYMHRLLGPKVDPDEVVNHVNGNRKDNRGNNLMRATRSQNSQNRAKCTGPATSQHLGVSRCLRTGKFIARMSHLGQRTTLARSDSEEEAARAYNRAVLRVHGPRARTNKVNDSENSILRTPQGCTSRMLNDKCTTPLRRSSRERHAPTHLSDYVQ